MSISASICPVVFLSALFGFVHCLSAAVFDVSSEAQLRSALYTAQSNAQSDVVNIQGGTYALTSTLVYDTTEPYSVTLQGVGEPMIDGNGYRIMTMWARAANTNAAIVISGIVFTNGYVANEDVAGVSVRTQWGGLAVRDCTFAHCWAGSLFGSANYGGLYARIEFNGRLVCERSAFIGNHARGIAAGAAFIGGNGTKIWIANTLFATNDGSVYGGGCAVKTTSGTVDIRNNTFTANELESGVPGGGGLYVEAYGDDCTINILNNIAWTNSSGGGLGNDIYVNDDLDGNANGAVLKIQFNDLSDLDCAASNRMTLTGNTNVNPLLEANYTLKTNSPCIDRGTNLSDIVEDRSRVARPLDGNNDGAVWSDMGAYEFAGNGADTDADGMSDAAEVRATTNPTNNTSLLLVTGLSSVSGSTVRVSWKGGTQAMQVVQRSNELLPADTTVWSDIFTNRPPTAQSTNILDGTATNSTGFYRIWIP